MILNREDGGIRQFILCTNNENNIAEEVTYPRIRSAINGYADVEGIPANVRYFKTAFVTKSNVSDDTRYELVARATDMICVREGTFQVVADEQAFKVFENDQQYTAILYNIDALPNLREYLQARADRSVHIYVFSLTDDTYEEDFASLEQEHSLLPIPESILEVYRRIFDSR
jgi:adenine-specific DNA-methyltransferase